MKELIVFMALFSLNAFGLQTRTFDAIAECHISFKATEIWNDWTKAWELKTSSTWIPAYCRTCSDVVKMHELHLFNSLIYKTNYRSYIVGSENSNKTTDNRNNNQQNSYDGNKDVYVRNHWNNGHFVNSYWRRSPQKKD